MADDPTPDAPEATDPPQENPDPQPQGNDDGIDWKAQARKHEREAKKARQEADRLREQNQTAEEKAIEEAKKAGRTEAEAEHGAEVMTLRMENAVLRSDAAKKLADPSDALVFLDPSKVVDDGKVDPKALAREIDALLDRKPHLAAGAPTPTVPGGARNGSDRPADMNSLIRQSAGRG